MKRIHHKPGDRLLGYIVRRVAPVPDIGITCMMLDHENTGARHIHVFTGDDNNLFSVALRTPPTDSTGVAHILEHTVLCGSRRFPVRDPFFSMIKRSLSTFMNALTSDDWTMYPFSTRNSKDFLNLLDVYLDAVFFPNLRELDFLQEGHRLEFREPSDTSSGLSIKGVVYNEMKGAMSDPRSILGYRMMKAIFPTSTYGHNSGGDPEFIPDLTWEALKKFHSQYYHPGNARFFTYGHMEPERHLEVIEDRVLRHFGRAEVDSGVTEEPDFTSPLDIEDFYPVSASEDISRKSMTQTCWRTASLLDSEEVVRLRILSSLLLGNPGAPLYRALMESGLGMQLAPGTGFSDENLQTVFAAGLQGLRREDAGRVNEIIFSTLERLCREGFPEERVEAVIHRLEFSLREIRGDHFPYPLLLLFRMIGPWNHDGDPVSPLLLEGHLERIRREAPAGLFENLIKKYLLDNRHRVTLALHPDPDLLDKQESKLSARLSSISSGLTSEDRESIVNLTSSLAREQEETPDLSCLPSLGIEDISVMEEVTETEVTEESGVSVMWCPRPTNGITYLSVSIDASGVAGELKESLPFFASALPGVGAAGRDWVSMAELRETHTGGMSGTMEVLGDPSNLDHCRGFLNLRIKALRRKHESMFSILKDTCTAPDFSDMDRLHTLVGQSAASLENAVPQSGHRYAAGRASSGLTAAAALREYWSGIEHIRRMKGLSTLPVKELSGLSQQLNSAASSLIGRDRLIIAVIAEEEAIPELKERVASLIQSIPEGSSRGAPPEGPFTVRPAAEGLGASVSVSYVARAFRTVPLTHPDSAPLMVLAKLLRFGYLHREIREKGGAYGGMAAGSAGSGIFSMMSYRDPHLIRTLEVYRDAVEWAASGSCSSDQVKEAILGVFSDLDAVLSPEGRGLREFGYLRQGVTREMRQALRDRVLATNKNDLASVSEKYLKSGYEDSSMAVITSPEKIESEKDKLAGRGGLLITRI